MSAVLNYSARLVSLECYKCGVLFAIPHYFNEQRLADRLSFYCPNGHSQSYVESSVERVRREMQKRLDAETSRAEMWRRESESKKRELTAVKGAVTKLKRRISNGVCPVCKRNFAALGRHIRGQHPDFQECV